MRGVRNRVITVSRASSTPVGAEDENTWVVACVPPAASSSEVRLQYRPGFVVPQ